MAKNEAVQNQKVFITLDNFVLMQNHYRTLVENVNTSSTAANRERNLTLMRGYENNSRNGKNCCCYTEPLF